MLVKELLDKQYEWTYLVIGKESMPNKYTHKNDTFLFVDSLKHREEIYDEYGDKEVKYFYHFLHPNKETIVMAIQIEKDE